MPKYVATGLAMQLVGMLSFKVLAGVLKARFQVERSQDTSEERLQTGSSRLSRCVAFVKSS